jgi:DNA-binding Lrp family transcriptional regulator
MALSRNRLRDFSVRGTSVKLDEKDMHILSLLLKNGRAKYTLIARSLSKAMNESVPDTTVLFRIRKLKKSGVIKRFTASLDPEALGYTVYGIILAEIGGHILHDISVEHTRKIRADFESRSNVIFVALDQNETGIFALVLGQQPSDIEDIFNKLKDNPDVVDAKMWLLKPPTKGDSLIGTGVPLDRMEAVSDV